MASFRDWKKENTIDPFCRAKPPPAHALTGVKPSWRVIPCTSEPGEGQVLVDIDFVSCTS